MPTHRRASKNALLDILLQLLIWSNIILCSEDIKGRPCHRSPFGLCALNMEALSQAPRSSFQKDISETTRVPMLNWLFDYDIMFNDQETLLTFSQASWLYPWIHWRTILWKLYKGQELPSLAPSGNDIVFAGSSPLNHTLRKEESKWQTSLSATMIETEYLRNGKDWLPVITASCSQKWNC